MTNPTAPSPPVLVAAPGMTLAAVAAASTVPCRVRPILGGRGLAQPTGPHTVQLRHPTGDLELPAGLFTVLEAQDDIVRRLHVTPHIGYLDGEAALALLEGLARMLAEAGWVRVQERGRVALVARLPRAEEERLGLWRHGSWVAELRGRRAITRGTERARVLQQQGDAYLITFVVWEEQRA